MTVASALIPAAKIQGDFLPGTRHLQPLPDTAQRFFKSRQTLQDFHQPLHDLIRRLKEILQPLTDYTETMTIAAAGQSALTSRPARVTMERCREFAGGGMKHK